MNKVGTETLATRDSNDINNHLKVRFDDVLAEPPGAHSPDCTWQLSYRCFSLSVLCCYRFFAVFTSCFFSLCWGWWFAVTSFIHIWICTPCLRGFSIQMAFLQRTYGICYQCCQEPLWGACGYCLSHIRVDMLKHYLDGPAMDKPKSPPPKLFADTEDEFI